MSSSIKTIRDYLDRMQPIQTALIDFLDARTEKEKETNYKKLFYVLDDIKEDGNLLKSFLHLLLKVSKNHHHQKDYFNYVDNILNTFREEILKYYSNSEIFSIFKGHRRILLYLIKSKMIKIDQFVYTKMENDKYSVYFSPEIKEYLDKEQAMSITREFDDKRLAGENDSELASIIRDDDLKKFTEFVEEKNLKLSKKMTKSTFETNSFLLNNEPTIIEYAAFFGSFEIYQYLRLAEVEVKPSIWLYAIHGESMKIIQDLVDSKIKAEDKTYKKCLEEAIKCHNNKAASYIQSNLLKCKENPAPAFALQYYNFNLMRKDSIDESVFFDLCSLDYQILVDILIKTGKIDINARKSYITTISIH